MAPSRRAFMLAFTACLTACGGGGGAGAAPPQPTPTPFPPTPAPTSVATPAGAAGLDVALGDSISFGLSATVTCAPWPSTLVELPSACPHGTSFVVLVANALSHAAGAPEALLDLGTGGADAPYVYGAELGAVPANATLVTLTAGTNDTRNAAESQFYRGGNLATQLAVSERAYDAVLAGLALRAPQARVVLIDSPNEAYLAVQPQGAVPAALIALYDRASQAFDKFVIAHADAYPVVDVTCDPRTYEAAYSDNVHPNDAGHALLATKVEAAVAGVAPAPSPLCPPYLTAAG